MWDTSLDFKDYEGVLDKMSKHYNDASMSVDEYLAQRISKLTLILIPFFIIFIYSYVLPLVKKLVFEWHVAMIIIKALLYVPIVNIFIKKILRSKFETIYEAMANALFDNRGDIFERIPREGLSNDYLKKRIDKIFKEQHDGYATGLHSGTIYAAEEKEFNDRIEKAMKTFAQSDQFDLSMFVILQVFQKFLKI